jgi:hypothetical protein
MLLAHARRRTTAWVAASTSSSAPPSSRTVCASPAPFGRADASSQPVERASTSCSSSASSSWRSGALPGHRDRSERGGAAGVSAGERLSQQLTWGGRAHGRGYAAAGTVATADTRAPANGTPQAETETTTTPGAVAAKQQKAERRAERIEQMLHTALQRRNYAEVRSDPPSGRGRAACQDR